MGTGLQIVYLLPQPRLKRAVYYVATPGLTAVAATRTCPEAGLQRRATNRTRELRGCWRKRVRLSGFVLFCSGSMISAEIDERLVTFMAFSVVC